MFTSVDSLPCAKELEEELASRANPEKSRLFDRARLIASLQGVMKATEDWKRSGQRITVVGSNGKGSTAFFLAGLPSVKTGLYTSPHLLNVTERIRIDGTPVDACALLDILPALKERTGKLYTDLSYFEVLTLAALHLFEEQSCAVQVYEAGLGGRFDAVHAARSQTIVLTAVSLEHMQILGRTRREILAEKLAIITSASERLIVMPQTNTAEDLSFDVIAREARTHNPSLDVVEYRERFGSGGSYIEYNRRFASFVLSQCGIVHGSVPRFSAPGRLEEHRVRVGASGTPLRFLYDSGHNPEAVWHVLRYLRGEATGAYDPQRTLVIVGVLRDRSPAECLLAAQSAGYVHFRVLEAEFLAKAPPDFPGAGAVEPGGLVGLAEDAVRQGMTAFVVIGSHYIYNFFLEMKDSFQKTGKQIDDAG
ncbi:MAG: hypothetical protein HY042_06070 [Spirochaetia bacterium]|nr:hypothetical protein [Spirochaetia bacterium]